MASVWRFKISGQLRFRPWQWMRVFEWVHSYLLKGWLELFRDHDKDNRVRLSWEFRQWTKGYSPSPSTDEGNLDPTSTSILLRLEHKVSVVHYKCPGKTCIIPSVNVFCKHWEYTEQSSLFLSQLCQFLPCMLMEGLHELVQPLNQPAQPLSFIDQPAPHCESFIRENQPRIDYGHHDIPECPCNSYQLLLCGKHSLPSTDDHLGCSFPANWFHFIEAIWSSINGST